MAKYLSAREIDWKGETAEKLNLPDRRVLKNVKTDAGSVIGKNCKLYGCYLEGCIVGDGSKVYRTLICPGVKLGERVRVGKLSEIFLPITLGERCTLDNVILHASGDEYRASISVQEDRYQIDEDIPIEIKRVDETINSEAISLGRRWRIDGISEGYISNKMSL